MGAGFVGRGVQLAELDTVLASASTGSGELVIVAGEAGIGKTRLAGEVVERARDRGFAVAEASCWDGDGAPPLWPWVQVARAIAARDPALSAAGVLADALLSGPPDADGAGRAGAGRFRLFDATERLLREAAARRPWLLVVDDVQWADRTSVLMLDFVAPALRGMGVVVLATSRNGAEPAGAASSARRVVLPGLAAAELTELVAPLAGELDAESADHLWRRTGGNPLFATELVRLAAAQGLSVDVAGVPGSVRAVLSRRLSRLSARTRDTLTTAAVLGVEFGLDQLGVVAAGPVLDAVDEAVAAALLRRRGPGRYGFSHALVREAVYEGLGLTERARRHERVADALADLAASGAVVDPAVLAHHYGRAVPAGRGLEAARYAVLAARAATAVLGYPEAVRHLVAALQVLDVAPAAADRGTVLLALAEAQLAAGDAAGARHTWTAAAVHARTAERPEQLARAALGIGGGLTGFEVPVGDREQVELLQEALSRLPDDAPLRVWVTARLSVALGDDEPARRVALATEAVAVGREAGNPAMLTAALAAQCDAIAGPADTERRLELAAEIVALSRTAGDVHSELLGRRLRLVALLERGDIAAADTEISLFEHRVGAIRHPLYAWYPPLWRAMRAAMAGRLGDAEREIAAAEAAGARVGSFNAAVLAVSHRWGVLAETGRGVEGYALLRAFLDRTPYADPFVELAMALALAQADRREEARGELDRIAPSLPQLPVGSEWLPAMAQVAELIGLIGGHPAASWVYDALLPHRARHGLDGIGAYCYGSIERHLGLLAAALDEPEVARAHFTAARSANRAAPLLVARTVHDAGVALGEAELLAQARAAYAALAVSRRTAEPDARLASPAPSPAGGEFRRSGEVWTLRWHDRSVTVKDTKGVRDLAQLLARPGVELAAVELAGAALHAGHTGEVVDGAARAAYRARLRVLDDELAAADAAGDAVRSRHASDERDALLAQLSAAYGRGGRPRRSGDVAEKARSAVGWRIRDALRRIETVHPELARHLRHSVRTGHFCSYSPEHPVHWRL